MDIQSYWHDIRERVCVKCIDGDGEGNCRLDPSSECAVITYLPLIIDAVGRVKSSDIAVYETELRLSVCSRCRHTTAGNHCTLRTELECGLDRYFPLIVNAIEECGLSTAGRPHES